MDPAANARRGALDHRRNREAAERAARYVRENTGVCRLCWKGEAIPVHPLHLFPVHALCDRAYYDALPDHFKLPEDRGA